MGEAGSVGEKRIREKRSRTGDQPGFGGGRGRPSQGVDERKKTEQERASGRARVVLVGYKPEGCREQLDWMG